jgi:hypothetical protein
VVVSAPIVPETQRVYKGSANEHEEDPKRDSCTVDELRASRTFVSSWALVDFGLPFRTGLCKEIRLDVGPGPWAASFFSERE